MYAVRDLSQRTVGWMAGDVLYNTEGDVCAFVRGSEVFTFCRRHVGRYDRGQFCGPEGRPVGTARPALCHPRRQRRRRFRLAPWLRFSLPAPQPRMIRTWGIWDRAIDTLSA